MTAQALNDIAAGLGAPIYASDTGVVVFAGKSTRGYGNLIIVDHGNGWQTAYAFDVIRGVKGAAEDTADSRKAFLASGVKIDEDIARLDTITLSYTFFPSKSRKTPVAELTEPPKPQL